MISPRVYRSDNPPPAGEPAPAPAAPAPTVIPIAIPSPAPAAPAATPNTTSAAPSPAPNAPSPAPKPDEALNALQERLTTMEKQLIEQTRARVIAETGVKAEAGEFITATDEAGMRAQAEKIKALAPAPAAPEVPAPTGGGNPAPAPRPAGTVTNPAATGAPTLDEQIAAAEKSGKALLAITLKRQKAFGSAS